MPRKRSAASPVRQTARPSSHIARSATWKLEDAKAKFSEVVRRAHDHGPQYVTVRGKPAVAIIDVAELARLMPTPAADVPLVDFLESLHLENLDLSRERDLGRNPTL
jgi:antitoxin Phd